MQAQKIAFAGLGKMGGGIAERLASEGFDLMVYDVYAPAMERFQKNCRLAGSLEELAAYGEILCVSLPSSKEVDAAVDAFLAAGAAGRYFLDLSTSYPMATIRNAKRVKEAGGSFFEGPLTGVPAQAPEGKLGLIAAGDGDVYERLLPVLSAVASKISYAGKSGCGHLIKLSLNYLTISYIALYAEIMPLLEQMGVDYEAFYQSVTGGAADCGMFQRIAPKIHEDDYAVTFLMRHAIKDIGYVKQLYTEKGYPSPMLDSCVSLFHMAKCMGLEGKDVSEVARTLKFFMNHEDG